MIPGSSAALGPGLPFGPTLGTVIGAGFAEDHRTGYPAFGALVA
ncbi:hypothetical protein [Streptomyces sp. gCLA4]|nr:hypothetical protein [Streptomyces sp. gCLA4]